MSGFRAWWHRVSERLFRQRSAPVSDAREILAETMAPDGLRVVLFADTWATHIVAPDQHPELASHLGAVLDAVSSPDHREPDVRAGRERFFKEGVGPSRWLMVVVDFGHHPARIVTALGYRHGRSPRGWIS